MILGVLNCLDGFMNIAMENSEESFGERTIQVYKSIFIRGNNGTIVFK
jgi:U6 snRNA-associated Sm-like protein LSm6